MKPDWGRQQQDRLHKQQEELMRRQQEQMRRQQQEQLKQQQDLLRRQQMANYYQQKKEQKGGKQSIQPSEQNRSLQPDAQSADMFLQVANVVTELRRQLTEGKLSIDQVQEKLLSLAIRDDVGTWWSVGFQSGDWYCYDGDQWIKAGLPPQLQSLLSRGTPKAGR